MQSVGPRRRMILTVGLLAAAQLIGACEPSTTAIPDVRLQVVSGAEQVGGAGAPLGLPVVVAVFDARDRPVADIEVRWRVIEGGGTVDDVITRSDSLGQSRNLWTLGTGLGRQLLLVEAGHSAITISARSELRISRVTAGFRHTCALSSTGQAYCWGANLRGQLGDRTPVFSRAEPARVVSPYAFRLITAGGAHTCGISIVGTSLCWGDDIVGQLGVVPPGAFHALPTPVAAADSLVTLSAGYVHTCGVSDRGQIVCWGEHRQGQLGGPQSSTVRIPGVQFRDVAAGEFHSCGIRTDNVVLCWGWNSTGDLGTDAPWGAVIPTPTPVASTVRFTALAAGVRHTCGLDSAGAVYCWGRSAGGEIGQNPIDHKSIPTLVPGTTGYTVLGTGNAITCGIASQRAFCWGEILGNGTADWSKSPTPVRPDLMFTDLAVGLEHACGVADGQV